MSEAPSPSNGSDLSSGPSSRPNSKGSSGKIILALVVVGIGAAAWASRSTIVEQFNGSDDDEFAHLVTEQARKATLLVAVNIQGSLDSQENAILKSKVEGSTTIIYIIPEGTTVEEGELLAELDSAQQVDEAKQQEIVVTNSDAAESQAKEQLEVTRKQNESDIAAAELALRLAILDRDKYKLGEFPKLDKELDGNLKLALQEAVQSEDTYEFTKRLVKRGYKNQNELEAARIQVEKTDLAVEKAREELKVLRDFEKDRMMAELTHNAEEFGRELERVKLKAKAAEVQAEQAYNAAQKSAELEREKLEKLNTQIANCKLYAPQAGEVVYANLPSQSRRGGSDGPSIEEGATVFERQAIINLPNVTKMKVDCRVHESLIGYLREGLPAKIRVDAKHDVIYNGRVETVSTVPMTGRWPNTDLREYEVLVHLTDDVEKVRTLRPGLTAKIEILVNSRPDILQVPVQSVVGVGGKRYAFVLADDGPQRRELKTGESNETDIEILDGVAEGEKVIMNPRTHFAEEIAELATILGAERNKELGSEMPPEETLGPPGGGGGGFPGAGGGPGGGRQRPGGAGGPQASAGGPQGGGGGERRGGGNPGQALSRMDTNGDGKLSKDEAQGGIASNFSSIDADGDGSLTSAEISKFFANRPAGGRQGGGGAGGGDRAGGAGGGGRAGGGGPGGGGGRPGGRSAGGDG